MRRPGRSEHSARRKLRKTLLSATLAVDDHIDLASLRNAVQTPPSIQSTLVRLYRHRTGGDLNHLCRPEWGSSSGAKLGTNSR